MTSEEMIGSVSYFGGDFAPVNTAICDGKVIAITSNNALYSIIGSFFGGDGRVTMGLPDMRGRAIIGLGSGPGLSSRSLAQKFGTETFTVRLGKNNLPKHKHSASFDASALNSSVTTTPDLSTLEMTVTLKCNSTAAGSDPKDAYPGSNASVDAWATSAPDAMMATDGITQADVDAVDVVTQFTTSTNSGQPIALQNTGGGASFENSNMPPYTTFTCVIALVGEYPPRS